MNKGLFHSQKGCRKAAAVIFSIIIMLLQSWLTLDSSWLKNPFLNCKKMRKIYPNNPTFCKVLFLICLLNVSAGFDALPG